MTNQQADPASMDAFSKRFQENQRVVGYGFDTHVVSPCPFCAAADFMQWYIADYDQMVTAMETTTTCSACQRSGKIAVVTQGNVTTSRLIQTDGPDVPDWFVPKPPRA